MSHNLLQLLPIYQPRVWGGQRLQAGAQPIGEAWVVHEHNRIAHGPHAGRTLAEVAAEQGAALLGAAVLARSGPRFPLLIKLLDCHDWLSVQVHPNDAQAVALEGPGQLGKTEAWHILEAAPEAQVIAGVKPGTTAEALAHAIRSGTILDWVHYQPVHAGDTVFMPAGTLHALGPGLLLYEVQQTSDITYRVFDWNRPASAGRALHLEQSVAVAVANASAPPLAWPGLAPDDGRTLLTCPYFTLDTQTLEHHPATLVPPFASFQIVTVVAGEVELVTDAERVRLKRFETVIIPASAPSVQLQPHGASRVLRAACYAPRVTRPSRPFPNPL